MSRLLPALLAALLCLLPGPASAKEAGEEKLSWSALRKVLKQLDQAADTVRLDDEVRELMRVVVSDTEGRTAKAFIKTLAHVCKREDKAWALASKRSKSIGKGRWSVEIHDGLREELRGAKAHRAFTVAMADALATGAPAMRAAFAQAALERADGRWHGLLARAYAKEPDGEQAIVHVYAAARHPDARARAAVLRALQCHPQGWEPLVSQRIRDDSWVVRALAIRLAVIQKNKRAVGEMIGALSCAPMRVQQLISHALEDLTGQSFGTNASKWAFWWQANRKYFGKHATKGAGPTCRKSRYVAFYDMEIHSDRVVFVIDLSGSMIQKAITGYRRDGTAIESDLTRIHLVRRQLARTMRSLEDGIQFNMVAFGETVQSWKPGLVKMDSRIRKQALRWVDALNPKGGTRLNGALHHIFAQLGFGDPSLVEPPADTLVVLSDGSPTDGWPSGRGKKGRAAVRGNVAEWNPDGLFVIHTVALRGAAVDFMKGLAEDNGGSSLVR